MVEEFATLHERLTKGLSFRSHSDDRLSIEDFENFMAQKNDFSYMFMNSETLNDLKSNTIIDNRFVSDYAFPYDLIHVIFPHEVLTIQTKF